MPALGEDDDAIGVPQRVVNPVERFATTYVAQPLCSTYNTLCFSGTAMILVGANYYYPAYARYRHTHWYRYRQEQAEFIRWICMTKNFPKVYYPEEVRPHKACLKFLLLLRVVQHFLTFPEVPDLNSN